MESTTDNEQEEHTDEDDLLDEYRPKVKVKGKSKLTTKSASKKIKAKYTQESFRKALQDIRQGRKGIREACRYYGVPRGTIQDRLHCRVADEVSKRGALPIMGVEGEIRLSDYIINMTKKGFPVTKQTSVNIVANLAKDMPKIKYFKNGIPGLKWMKSFLNRHPEIIVPMRNAIRNDRTLVTEDKIRDWFNNLREYLSGINASEILNNSDKILIAEESGFTLCPNTGMVLAPNVYEDTVSKDKGELTTLIICTASGKICPPLVVIPYQQPFGPIIPRIPNNWVLGGSESGSMHEGILYEYICSDFNKWLEENKIPKPVLLLVDSHKAQIIIPLKEFCEKNYIILFSMPPTMNQPADVSISKALERVWQGTVESFYSDSNELWKSEVKETNVCPLLEQALYNFHMSELIKNGFQTCGLFPFDEEAVDYSKCVKVDAKKSKKPLN